MADVHLWGIRAVAVATLAALCVPAWAGSIDVRVIDEREAAVVSARVLLQGTARREGSTDSSGRVSFGGLSEGAYLVRVETSQGLLVPAGDRRAVVEAGGRVSLTFALFREPVTLISQIQGRSHRSPLNREPVRGVPGVVTALRGRLGFYMQSPLPDQDAGTSEGILVTGIGVPAVRPGDLVVVDGRVEEYYGGGPDAGDLSVTRLRASDVRTLISGAELPQPVVLGERGRIPPDRVICDDAAGNAEESLFDPENGKYFI